MRGEAGAQRGVGTVHFEHAAVGVPGHRRQIRRLITAGTGDRDAVRFSQRKNAQHGAQAAAERGIGLQDIECAAAEYIAEPRHRLDHLARRERDGDRPAQFGQRRNVIAPQRFLEKSDVAIGDQRCQPFGFGNGVGAVGVEHQWRTTNGGAHSADALCILGNAASRANENFCAMEPGIERGGAGVDQFGFRKCR